MNMNTEKENFESLRRMLALKRHEQPPPGYFANFSQQVITQIKSGATGNSDARLDVKLWEVPWFQRFWAGLGESQAAMAGAFGVLVCGLLVSAVAYSVKAPSDSTAVEGIPLANAQVADSAAATHPLLAEPVPVEFPSTRGVPTLDTRNSLFPGTQPIPGIPDGGQAVPAMFKVANGN